ncbi:hypothetical protein BDC45DRAFT_523026 [Circinella umbellata]|nr:hypothetical protein BDC45DRAFT_523026 [Circinella umbellata]
MVLFRWMEIFFFPLFLLSLLSIVFTFFDFPLLRFFLGCISFSIIDEEEEEAVCCLRFKDLLEPLLRVTAVAAPTMVWGDDTFIVLSCCCCTLLRLRKLYLSGELEPLLLIEVDFTPSQVEVDELFIDGNGFK